MVAVKIEPEFDGFYHVRMKSGFELVGQLYWVGEKKDLPVLYFPIRVMYNVTDLLTVRYSPFSLFSGDDFFQFNLSDVEFLLEMNERSTSRYLSYCDEYQKTVKELDDEEKGETEAPPEGSVLH